MQITVDINNLTQTKFFLYGLMIFRNIFLFRRKQMSEIWHTHRCWKNMQSAWHHIIPPLLIEHQVLWSLTYIEMRNLTSSLLQLHEISYATALVLEDDPTTAVLYIFVTPVEHGVHRPLQPTGCPTLRKLSRRNHLSTVLIRDDPRI